MEICPLCYNCVSDIINVNVMYRRMTHSRRAFWKSPSRFQSRLVYDRWIAINHIGQQIKCGGWACSMINPVVILAVMWRPLWLWFQIIWKTKTWSSQFRRRGGSVRSLMPPRLCCVMLFRYPDVGRLHVLLVIGDLLDLFIRIMNCRVQSIFVHALHLEMCLGSKRCEEISEFYIVPPCVFLQNLF